MIVRAPGKSVLPDDATWDRRERLPTLPGLGYRMEADTLPAFGLYDLLEDEATPISCVRVKVAPRPEAPRALIPPPCPVPDILISEFASVPDFANDVDEATPISCVRLKVSVPPLAQVAEASTSFILPPRARPATLLDGVDDALSRKYREEAERILNSGLFHRDGTEELE